MPTRHGPRRAAPLCSSIRRVPARSGLLPAGWRIKESAEGIFGTVVNGQVLYEEGKYTGALPGKVLRNSHYEQNRRSNA